jgi:hypothetical protein
MNYLSIKMHEKDSQYKGHRNSYTELNEVYFWTITVNKWQQLSRADENKNGYNEQLAVVGPKGAC